MSAATDRVLAAAKLAPAGFLPQACRDCGIDPRKVREISDIQADAIVARLEAFGPRQPVKMTDDGCGDGEIYVRTGRI